MNKIFVYLLLLTSISFLSYFCVLFFILVSKIGFNEVTKNKVLLLAIMPILWIIAFFDKDIYKKSKYKKRYVFILKMIVSIIINFDIFFGYGVSIAVNINKNEKVCTNIKYKTTKTNTAIKSKVIRVAIAS